MTDGWKRLVNQHPHDPENGSWGDCHRVSVAFILGLPIEEVPHFFDEGRNGEEGNALVDEFLLERGLVQTNFGFPGELMLADILGTMHYLNPNTPYILGGESEVGCNHSVVCLGGEIINNSTPSALVGPCKDSFWYVTMFNLKMGDLYRAR